MANLTGTAQAFHGDTAAVDSSRIAELGRRAWDTSGNEYVYLQGTAATVSGDWVVYDDNYGTERLAVNKVGPVAVTMAAVVANSFGWYQIFGKNTIARTDTVAANKSLYIDGTVGRADDLGVAGDLIIGAYSMTADTANVATVSLNYPSVSDDLGGGASVAGSDTQVQFNDGGAFGADADFTFNKTTGTVTAVGYRVGTASIIPVTNDDAALGSAAVSFADLFLATGGVVNFNNGNMTLTHAANNITAGGGDFRVSTSGTATTSVATLAGTQTLTNKTINLTSNTLAGTTAQFNTALSDNDFATLAGTETLTNKTIAFGSNTVSGTTAQFNTALTDGDFATLAGTETLTNKTIAFGSNTVSGTTAQFNTALTDGDFATLAGTETLTNKTIGVASMGTGTTSFLAYGVLTGGTTTTGPIQSLTSLGSSGQVLTSNGAGAIPTFQAAAGGGANEFTHVLTPRDAVLPNTNFPSLDKVGTATFIYEALGFDTTTSEAAYWYIPIPPSATPGTHKMTLVWTNPSGATTETVQWDLDWRSVSDGESLDAAIVPTTVNDTVSDTWIAQGTAHSVTLTLSSGTNVVAGDILEMKISRDVANDNMAGDVRLVSAVYEITS